MYSATRSRRLPVGAEVLSEGGTHFRVWAPKRKKVEVVIERAAGIKSEGVLSTFELEPEPQGYFSGAVRQAQAGTLYRFRLDGGGGSPTPLRGFNPRGRTGRHR